MIAVLRDNLVEVALLDQGLERVTSTAPIQPQPCCVSVKRTGQVRNEEKNLKNVNLSCPYLPLRWKLETPKGPHRCMQDLPSSQAAKLLCVSMKQTCGCHCLGQAFLCRLLACSQKCISKRLQRTLACLAQGY